MSDALSPRRRPRCHTDSLGHTALQRRLRKSLAPNITQSVEQLPEHQQVQQAVQQNFSSTNSSDSLPLHASPQQQRVQMLLVQPSMYGSVPQQLNTMSNQYYSASWLNDCTNTFITHTRRHACTSARARSPSFGAAAHLCTTTHATTQLAC